jgi:hypothetical protein
MNTIQERVIKELGKALKMFGTYSFDDKGPDEVMNIEQFVTELETMPVADAAVAILEIATMKYSNGRTLRVAEYLVQRLEENEKFFDELVKVPGIEDVYNGDPPGKPRMRPDPVFIDCGHPVAVFTHGEWKPIK